jgi:hypothetical protein
MNRALLVNVVVIGLMVVCTAIAWAILGKSIMVLPLAGVMFAGLFWWFMWWLSGRR